MKRLHQHKSVVDFPARALRAAWFSVDLTPPNVTIWIMVRAKLQLRLALNWNYDKLGTRGDSPLSHGTNDLHPSFWKTIVDSRWLKTAEFTLRYRFLRWTRKPQSFFLSVINSSSSYEPKINASWFAQKADLKMWTRKFDHVKLAFYVKGTRKSER